MSAAASPRVILIARDVRRRRSFARLRALAWAAIAAAFAGCGGGDPFDYVPISGRLTYEDGEPIPAPGIRLFFHPVDVPPQGDMYPRPAGAEVDADGRFDCATSVSYGDGVVPGRQKVVLYYATDADGRLLVPEEYTHSSTTPLEIDSSDSPLEIKVPRPARG
jgi:hypothetical protein